MSVGLQKYGGLRGRGRSKKTWEECLKRNMDLLGLKQEWAVNRDLIRGEGLTIAYRGRSECFQINDDDVISKFQFVYVFLHFHQMLSVVCD